MAQFRAIAPVLCLNAKTMQPTIELLTDILGFQIDSELGEPVSFTMLERDKIAIMLICKPRIPWPHKGWAAYIWVDNIDELYEELNQKNSSIVSKPVEKDYGVIEISVLIPDKRKIVFGMQKSATG